VLIRMTANTSVYFDTLAKHRALNSEEQVSMFSILKKEFENRITESLESEGTLKGHLVQLLNSEQGHARLDQVAQGLVLQASP